MFAIIGLIIGLAAGTVQFLLLSRFASGVTGDGISAKAMVCGIVQFILPFVVLMGCAFLLRRDLLPAGIGIIVALFGGTAIKAILSRVKRKEQTSGEAPGEASGESGEEPGEGR